MGSIINIRGKSRLCLIRRRNETIFVENITYYKTYLEEFDLSSKQGKIEGNYYAREIHYSLLCKNK